MNVIEAATFFEIGTFLEAQGLSDESIDIFLEHYGAKGMKWGVRRDRRANNLAEVGIGENGSRLRALARYTPLDALKFRGLKKASGIRGERQLSRNARVRAGESSMRDKLVYYGGTKLQDIIPTGKSASNTRAAAGASIAGAMLIGIGMQAFKRLSSSGG